MFTYIDQNELMDLFISSRNSFIKKKQAGSSRIRVRTEGGAVTTWLTAPPLLIRSQSVWKARHRVTLVSWGCMYGFPEMPICNGHVYKTAPSKSVILCSSILIIFSLIKHWSHDSKSLFSFCTQWHRAFERWDITVLSHSVGINYPPPKNNF